MAPHQQRVVDEQADLNEKIAKLECFIETEGSFFQGLPKEEQTRLKAQANAMQHYSDILQERIAAF